MLLYLILENIILNLWLNLENTRCLKKFLYPKITVEHIKLQLWNNKQVATHSKATMHFESECMIHTSEILKI